MSGRSSAVERGHLIVAVRFFAAIRLACMTLIALYPLLTADSSQDDVRADAVVALGTVYAFGLAGLALRRPESLLHWKWLTAIDAALVTALALSGSGLYVWAVGYPFLPVLIALVVRPLTTFLLSISPIVILVAYAVVSPFSSASYEDQDIVLVMLSLVGFVFPALVGAGCSAVRLHMGRAAVENARREVLAATIVRVEARERHELADALHDGPVQHLAAAYREVTSSLQGGQGRLEDARASLGAALEQLRGEIFDLYPHVLDHAGLAAAVSEVVRRSEERGGFTTRIDIDPSAPGIDDATVMAVLRELLTNAAKHAEATHVDVKIANERGASLLVEVRDDGRGFTLQPSEEAAKARRFGLHSMGDRLLALGGSLDMASEPGHGTRTCARIPISRPDDGQGAPERRRIPRVRARARGGSWRGHDRDDRVGDHGQGARARITW